VQQASCLLVKTHKLTMQIHSSNIVCDRKSPSKYSNMVPQGTVRGRKSSDTIHRHMFKGTARASTAASWPHRSPGAHSLHASPGNLSTTMRSPARQKESEGIKSQTSCFSSITSASGGIREEIRGGFRKPLVN